MLLKEVYKGKDINIYIYIYIFIHAKLYYSMVLSKNISL